MVKNIVNPVRSRHRSWLPFGVVYNYTLGSAGNIWKRQILKVCAYLL